MDHRSPSYERGNGFICHTTARCYLLDTLFVWHNYIDTHPTIRCPEEAR